jgi:heme-degrading monooxygenase HmoA
MYLRSVQFRISADHLWLFRKSYEESIIPELQKAPGCLYAALVCGDEAEEDVLSLTLWDGEEGSGAYEMKRAFSDLVEQSKEMTEASDYKIRLTPDMQLEYSPESPEPVFQSYTVKVHTDISRLLHSGAPLTFLRIVNAHVRPEMADEFARIYEREIAPTVLGLPGCRFSVLVANTHDRGEYLSLTLWDTPQDAGAYEQSGTFNRLTEKLKHTFSVLYQWKLGVEQEPGKLAATSDDLVVRTYHVLAARSVQQAL